MRISSLAVIGGLLMTACNSEQAKAEPVDFQHLGGSVLNSKSKVADSKVFLKRDGTYVLTIPGRIMRNGTWDSKGVWRADGTKLCTTATEPLPAPKFREEYCQDIPTKNYGDSWTIASQNGDVEVTIQREETDL